MEDSLHHGAGSFPRIWCRELQYTSLKGPKGEKVFEAYAQQRTPSAYRVFWYYGPEKNQITIATIIHHP